MPQTTRIKLFASGIL